MSTILTFLGNLKLSIQQWLLLALAAACGVLVVALRLQGSKLHAAQVALLQAQYGNAVATQDVRVNNAKARFEVAKKAFEENK